MRNNFLIALTLFLTIHSTAFAAYDYLPFQGIMTDASDVTITSGTVNLSFKFYAPAAVCELYTIDYVAVPVDGKGLVSINVGSGGAVSYSGGLASLKDVFDNTKVAPGFNCNGGGNYLPAAGDDRRVKVFVNAVDPGVYISLGSVPFAMLADNAAKIDGSTVDMKSTAPIANDVLTYNGTKWIPLALPAEVGDISSVTAGTGLSGGAASGAATLNIANTTVTAGSYGSANQVGTFTVNAQGQLTAAGNTAISIGPDQIASGLGKYFSYAPNGSPCANNQILQMNGSNQWVCANPSSGTVTGSGTQWTLPVFNNAGGTQLGNSMFSQNAGGTLASISGGNLDMTTNKITNVVDPTAAQDAATKAYVDTGLAGKQSSLGFTPVNKAGDTMTGSLAMGANNITGTGSISSGSFTSSAQAGHTFNPYGAAAGNTGESRYMELAANGANYVGFKAPDALVGNVIWTLPIADGSSGQVLKTDGSGNLSWVTPAGGGLTSFNGSAQSSQSLAAPGTTGTAPNWSTNAGTGVHTLNIPMASSAGTTAGLISKSDYDNFNLGSTFNPGSVVFRGASNLAQDNSNFFWDDTNNRLGIGTSVPGLPLDVQGNAGGAAIDARILNNSTGGAGRVTVSAGGTGSLSVEAHGTTSSYGNVGVGDAREANTGAVYWSQGSPLNIVGGAASSYIKFYTAGDLAANERMRIDTSGNVGIGVTGASSKLDINGAQTVRGMAAPAVSAAGQGRIYFDSTSNTFKVSQNGGAYVNMLAAGSYLPLSGGTMTGAIAMGGFAISGASSYQTNSWGSAATPAYMINVSSTGIYGNAGGDFLVSRSGAMSMYLGSSGVSVGSGAAQPVGTNVVILGTGAGTVAAPTVSNSVFLGPNSDGVASQNGQIAIGSFATTTAANQAVMGSTTAPINDFYIGKGVTAAVPTGIKINATGGFGADIAGADLTIAGGRSTGNANGGKVVFQTSKAAGAGSTLNALSTRMSVLQDGAVNFTGIPTVSAPAISGASTGNIYFDSTSNTFKVSQNGGAYVDMLGGGGGVTSVGASAPLSSSGGATPSISLTGTIPIANGGTNNNTAYTAGSVIYYDGTTTKLDQDNANFFYDKTNSRLGVRTNAPGASIHGVAPSGGSAVKGVSSGSGIGIEGTVNSPVAGAKAIYGSLNTAVASSAAIWGNVTGGAAGSAAILGETDLGYAGYFRSTSSANTIPTLKVEGASAQPGGSVLMQVNDNPGTNYMKVFADGHMEINSSNGAGGLDMTSEKIVNVQDPTGTQDAATMGWVAANYWAASNGFLKTDGSNSMSAALNLNGYKLLNLQGGTSAATPSIQFSGDTDTGIFSPAVDNIGFSTAGAERMRIDASGNVGIGTTGAPTAALQVGDLSEATTAPYTYLNGLRISGGENGPTSNTIWQSVTDKNLNITIASTLNSKFVGLGPQGNPALVVTGAGNVGIGITSPANLLHVVGTSSSMARFEAYANPSNIFLARANGSAGAPTAVINTDRIGGLSAIAHDGTGFSGTAAMVGMWASENWGVAAHGTYINFMTTANGTTAVTERMRIDASGNVGIGTNAPNDVLSFGIAPAANNSKALVNLSNTGLSAGSVSGTYIGANPGGFAGDFVNFQVGNVSKFRVSAAGVISGDGTNLVNVPGTLSGMTSGQIPVASSGNAVATYSGLTFNATTGLQVSTNIPADSTNSTLTLYPNSMLSGGTNQNQYGQLIQTSFTTNGNNSTATVAGQKIFNVRSFDGASGQLINRIAGQMIYFGNGSTMGTGITTNSMGIYVAPYYGSGTVTNSYGLYIDSPQMTGGTITNKYGIYQADGATSNYFAGNVGIGNPSPSTALDVTGSANVSGSISAGGTYYANGGITTTAAGNALNMMPPAGGTTNLGSSGGAATTNIYSGTGGLNLNSGTSQINLSGSGVAIGGGTAIAKVQMVNIASSMGSVSPGASAQQTIGGFSGLTTNTTCTATNTAAGTNKILISAHRNATTSVSVVLYNADAAGFNSGSTNFVVSCTSF